MLSLQNLIFALEKEFQDMNFEKVYKNLNAQDCRKEGRNIVLVGDGI